MMSQRILRLFSFSLFILLTCACGARPRGTSAPLPTVTPTSGIPHEPGVADLLRNPPPGGELIEVDAYFSGAMPSSMFGGSRPPLPDQVACPTMWNSALTDQPFLPALRLAGSAHSNTLADDAPWLIATIPEATEPGKRVGGDFPYHARFRGRLGEPAFADCLHPERIFVVEEVVIIYEQQPQEPPAYQLELPDGYDDWPRYHDAALAYSVPYPPDWTVEPLSEAELLGAVALRAPQSADYPVIVRIHEGETTDDQYEPSSIAALLQQANGGGVFQQGGTFEAISQTQLLSGYSLHIPSIANKDKAAILFNAHGQTYELSLDYPLGFEASQSLLTHFSAIVEGFQLDMPPPSSPIPPPPAPEPTLAPNTTEIPAATETPIPVAPTPAETGAFKGMELYSWQDENNEWVYSILIGTNREKERSEVEAVIFNLNAVKEMISEMPAGEYLSWRNQVYERSSKQSIILPFPPDEIIQELKELASSHDIELGVATE